MSKKSKGINPELEAAINSLMASVTNDPTASITDKMRVIDRALKLEQLKLKGYRIDDLGNERWIYRSKAYLSEEAVVDDVKIELD